MTAGEFRAAHDAFVTRFRQPDGSVAPGAAPPMAMAMTAIALRAGCARTSPNSIVETMLCSGFTVYPVRD